jgi:hypothetical protein
MSNEFHYSDTILPNLYPLIWAGVFTDDVAEDSEDGATNTDRLMVLHDEHPDYLQRAEALFKTLQDAGYALREDFGYTDTSRGVRVQFYSPDGKRLMWVGLEDLGA